MVGSKWSNYVAAPPCHKGNVKVMHVPGKGALYAGGWSHDANPNGFAVIDLTGSKSPKDETYEVEALNDEAAEAFAGTIELNQSHAKPLPWLSFAVKDFGVPDVAPETWPILAQEVRALLDQGINVLVACNGGHGRTGTVVSILCYLMNPAIGDPVEYVRKVYCNDAVENATQHRYVNKVLGLAPPKEDTYYKHSYGTGVTYYGAGKSAGQWDTGREVYGGAGMYGLDYDARLAAEDYDDTPPTSLLSQMSKKSTAIPNITDLMAALDELGADYTVVDYADSETLEVAVVTGAPHGELECVFYEVIKYDEHTRSVRAVEAGGTAHQERWLLLEALATTTQVNKFFEDDVPPDPRTGSYQGEGNLDPHPKADEVVWQRVDAPEPGGCA